MKFFKHLFKTLPLFLLCGLISGVSLNFINNEKDLEAANASSKTHETIKIYGDYDRLGSVPGQHKGNNAIRGWGDYALNMNYVDMGNDSYYEAYIDLKKGDSFILHVEGWSDDTAYIGFRNTMDNEFNPSNPNNPNNSNIICDKPGTYYLKYKESGLSDSNGKYNGWFNPVKVDLNPIYFNWKYNYPLPDDQTEGYLPGLEIYKEKNNVSTGWFEEKQYEEVDGYYRLNIVNAIKNQQYNMKVTANSSNAESDIIDLKFLKDVRTITNIYATVESTMKVKLDLAQRHDIYKPYKTKNDTARIWFDRGLSFEKDKFFVAMHLWKNSDILDIYPSKDFDIGFTDTRNTSFYDVPIKYLKENYGFKLQAYSVENGAMKHGTPDYQTSLLNSNSMHYVSGINNDITLGVSCDPKKDQYIDVHVLSLVIEPYFTCSDSKYNGYGDFKTWCQTWLGEEGVNVNNWQFVKNANQNVLFKDFLNESDYGTGENKTFEITLSNKLLTMEKMFTNTYPVNSIANFVNDNEMLIVILSMMTLTIASSILIIYFKRKKA